VLIVLELILIIGVLFVVLTQVIDPAIKGRPVFPMFRKQAKLEKEIEELNQRDAEIALEAKIKSKKEKQRNG